MTIYQKMKVENGQLVPTFTKVINQKDLTLDCWIVQFEGLTACENCEYKNTEDCGGGETLKKMKGEK